MKFLNLAGFLTALYLVSCSNKEKTTEESEPIFPVVPYIQSQVAHVDTSLYSILELNYRDSVNTDTQYIRREDFRKLATDFLELTDISGKKYRGRYKEEKLFDETMNRVILRYTPVDPAKEIIQKEEILIAPDPSGDNVTSIYIEQLINNRDSSMRKLLLWQVDKSFSVTTIIQKPGEAETTSIRKVTWNEEVEE